MFILKRSTDFDINIRQYENTCFKYSRSFYCGFFLF